MGGRFEVLYICQIAEPDAYDLGVYDGLAEGRDDAEWFEARLAELGLRDAVRTTKVRACVGEEIPAADGFDATVLGGSYHMVGEQRPWQRRILEWLRDSREKRHPVLGICGGHQLMGHLLGGAVTPLAGGTWSGTMPVRRTAAGRDHWMFRDIEEHVPFHFGNTEHVAPPPAGATVLAELDGSPALALDHGDGWVSVQFHPEMTAAAFACSWRATAPERAERYTESPRGAVLLRNFLVRAGLED